MSKFNTNLLRNSNTTHIKQINLLKYTKLIFVIASLFLSVLSISTLPAYSQGVKTDLGVYPEGSVPPLPQAGGKMTDSTFGTQVMRVTDEQDGTDLGTAYSYWSTFNLDNTRLLVQQNNSGTAYLYEFDPAQFNLGAKQVMTLPPGDGNTTAEDAVWSAVDPNKLFTHRGAVFYAFNAQQSSYTTIGDLSGQFPAGSYLWQMSVSRDDDIFAFTVKNPDDDIGGYAVWQCSTNKVIYSVRQLRFARTRLSGFFNPQVCIFCEFV